MTIKAREKTVATAGGTYKDPIPWIREMIMAAMTDPSRLPMPPTMTMIKAMIRISRPIMKST